MNKYEVILISQYYDCCDIFFVLAYNSQQAKVFGRDLFFKKYPYAAQYDVDFISCLKMVNDRFN